MKKLLLFVLVALVLLAGCAGNPKEKKTKIEMEPEDEYKIVDHKNRDFGGEPPNWVTMTVSELEGSEKYADFYIFIIDQTGKDLNGLKLWAKGFVASSEIARMVETRVEDKFVGAAAGDMDGLEAYMEEVVKSTSSAKFSGMRTEDEFWIKKKYNDGGEEFRYLFLVTVPRDQIDAAIQRAFEGTEKPKTEEKKTAVDRVKEAFGPGLE